MYKKIEHEDVGVRLIVKKKYLICMYDTLQHNATHCNTMQHTATRCNWAGEKSIAQGLLLITNTLCNILQHTATNCNTLHLSRRKRQCPRTTTTPHLVAPSTHWAWEFSDRALLRKYTTLLQRIKSLYKDNEYPYQDSLRMGNL